MLVASLHGPLWRWPFWRAEGISSPLWDSGLRSIPFLRMLGFSRTGLPCLPSASGLHPCPPQGPLRLHLLIIETRVLVPGCGEQGALPAQAGAPVLTPCLCALSCHPVSLPVSHLSPTEMKLHICS